MTVWHSMPASVLSVQVRAMSDMQPLAGYVHPGYVASLREFGTPRELPHCRGWILEREIPGFPDRDAMGCYPLFACQDWPQLHADLDKIGNKLVSLSLVTDPFGECDPSYLERCFKDLVVPFKEHFVTDLSRATSTFVSSHHQRYAHKALRRLCVERCQDPTQFIDDWTALYATLVDRHHIEGIRAFSTNSFARQLNVPGIVSFRAVYEDTTVGMLLWYVRGEVGYYHLGASSTRGYELRASSALFSFAIEQFSAEGLRWLSLGAGGGVKSRGTADGLTRFKRGWSTHTRTVYLCGRIFDPQRYAEIVKAKGIEATDYFPAYRKGEFG